MTTALAARASLPEPSLLVLRRPGGTITVRPAPEREPPFDDELAGPAAVGPLDQPLPFDEWRPRLPRRRPAPRRGPRTVPDPAGWGGRLLVGIIETSGGRRPLHQLSTLLSPAVAHGLGLDFEKAAKRGVPHWTSGASVRSVRVTEPADGVAELSATLRHGERVRAVAMRLEVRPGRWCCTRLVLG